MRKEREIRWQIMSIMREREKTLIFWIVLKINNNPYCYNQPYL